MTLPALAVGHQPQVVVDRRIRPDRRRGRPRVTVDLEAINVLLAYGWSHRRIAVALRVSSRTIDRRATDRLASAIMYRCHVCGALSLTSTCPNNHLINPGFLTHP